jgi:hypothetical protein
LPTKRNAATFNDFEASYHQLKGKPQEESSPFVFVVPTSLHLKLSSQLNEFSKPLFCPNSFHMVPLAKKSIRKPL